MAASLLCGPTFLAHPHTTLRMDTLKQFWSRQSPFNQFIIKALALYALWFLFYDKDAFGLKKPIDDSLTRNTAVVSNAVMHSLGINSEHYDGILKKEYINGVPKFSVAPDDAHIQYIFMEGRPAVIIENGCNGLVLMYLFMAFILAYPGPKSVKYWFVPAGILAIYIINVIRIILLTNVYHSYGSAIGDWHHKYTFQASVYAIIFVFWLLWANRYAKDALKQSAA